MNQLEWQLAVTGGEKEGHGYADELLEGNKWSARLVID
jgi:hypothetical protein